MKIMVVGGGGREHAIIKKLNENKNIEKIYALPGNGGMAKDAECVNIGAKDIAAIVDFAKNNAIDYAVVAPDDPLVLGAVDALNEIGIPCFGPKANAAIIEGSKVFSKNLMKKYGIPTAEYEVFDDMNAALTYLETAPIPTVIKADGLALGKGVIIAQTRDETSAPNLILAWRVSSRKAAKASHLCGSVIYLLPILTWVLARLTMAKLKISFRLAFFILPTISRIIALPAVSSLGRNCG